MSSTRADATLQLVEVVSHSADRLPEVLSRHKLLGGGGEGVVTKESSEVVPVAVVGVVAFVDVQSTAHAA